MNPKYFNSVNPATNEEKNPRDSNPPKRVWNFFESKESVNINIVFKL
jgi:hypothetical protein